MAGWLGFLRRFRNVFEGILLLLRVAWAAGFAAAGWARVAASGGRIRLRPCGAARIGFKPSTKSRQRLRYDRLAAFAAKT